MHDVCGTSSTDWGTARVRCRPRPVSLVSHVQCVDITFVCNKISSESLRCVVTSTVSPPENSNDVISSVHIRRIVVATGAYGAG